MLGREVSAGTEAGGRTRNVMCLGGWISRRCGTLWRCGRLRLTTARGGCLLDVVRMVD